MINQELIEYAKLAGFDVVEFNGKTDLLSNDFFITEELEKFAELIKARVLADMEAVKCPNCEDVGWFADYDQHGNIEQCQCQFCYTTPNSIFNLNEAIKLAKDK